MTDNTELQRLTRIRRLGRQIAAGLPGDLDLDRAFGVHGHVRELSAGVPRRMRAPTLSKAVLPAELEAALENYRGPVTLCSALKPSSGCPISLPPKISCSIGEAMPMIRCRRKR